MKDMKYKDYLGSIECDIDGDVLYGKLLHIRDLINYEADSPAEIKIAFEEAVDDYLSDCLRRDKEPDKPFKGNFNVRVSPNLHRELSVSAKRLGRTMNEYVTLTLEMHDIAHAQHGGLTVENRVFAISVQNGSSFQDVVSVERAFPKPVRCEPMSLSPGKKKTGDKSVSVWAGSENMVQ